MLTDVALRAAKPREKAYKLGDSGGLYLLVNPDGSAYWRLKYYFEKVEKGLACGVYRTAKSAAVIVTLKEARAQRDEARRLLAKGIDPAAARASEKEAMAVTFADLAAEFIKVKGDGLDPKTTSKWQWLLTYLAPLNNRPIASLTAPDVLAVLRKIEAKGINETAHRAMTMVSQILCYAIATGRAKEDVTEVLRGRGSATGALRPVNAESHAAVTSPEDVAELLRRIDAYRGFPTTLHAFRLAPLVFVRPGELRTAEWADINLDTAEWRIPKSKMKGTAAKKREHIVPLSRQALEILKAQHAVSGKGRYVFPSVKDTDKPMSNGTIRGALQRIGYTGEEMTGHGFRAMASTMLNEGDFNPDRIETQLAHRERNKTRAAYNRAQYLPYRVEMMQKWADYLDSLKNNTDRSQGGNVVPFRATA